MQGYSQWARLQSLLYAEFINVWSNEGLVMCLLPILNQEK